MRLVAEGLSAKRGEDLIFQDISFEIPRGEALVVKGRNRDTAWFSVIDGEWPALRERLDAWLDPANFDAAGHQRSRLSG